MAAKVRSRREDRPAIILDAAEGVLREAGARGLTIDAVAVEAGLSKGGVLHHYASKDALIRALVARKLQRLRAGFAEQEAKQPPGAAAAALAMIANSRLTYGEEDGFPRPLLLASAENREALADFRVFLGERLEMADRAGGKPGTGMVLVFAILGLMVGRTLGFHDLTGQEAERLFDALEAEVRDLDKLPSGA